MLHEFRIERFAFGEPRQPPFALRLALGLLAADEVALADHADQRAAAIDDRDGADAVVQQGLCDFAKRRLGRHRHDVAAHEIAGVHGLIRA